jgi:hypothetical protein
VVCSGTVIATNNAYAALPVLQAPWPGLWIPSPPIAMRDPTWMLTFLFGRTTLNIGATTFISTTNDPLVEEGPLAVQFQGTFPQPLWKLQHYVTEILNKTYLSNLFLTIPVAGNPITKYLDESLVENCVVELNPSIVNANLEVRCFARDAVTDKFQSENVTARLYAVPFTPACNAVALLILLQKANAMLRKHEILISNNGVSISLGFGFICFIFHIARLTFGILIERRTQTLRTLSKLQRTCSLSSPYD